MGDDFVEIEFGFLGMSDIYSVKIFLYVVIIFVKIGCLY